LAMNDTNLLRHQKIWRALIRQTPSWPDLELPKRSAELLQK